MSLAGLLSSYIDGDEQGWEAEFAWLRKWHRERLDSLATSVREVGIRDPVLLGNDGRVWDGHHRLCVADELGLPSVPFEIASWVPA